MDIPPLINNNTHRTWAQIDLLALERNIQLIREHLPSSVKYIAVVKADAYGHGLPQIASRMMQCKIDAFAVANVREGALIREIGSGWPIIVLSPILPEEYAHIIRYKLTPTLSCPQEVKTLQSLASQHHTHIPVHLKIDTGMGRSGVWHTEAHTLYHHIQQSPNLTLEGIYTHLKSAENNIETTQTQRHIFLNTLTSLNIPNIQKLLIHTDNSAGLQSFLPNSPINAVRVGILQYGISPYPESILSLIQPVPVLSFHSKICLIKKVPKGTAIGYNGTHKLTRDSILALLSAGYADGLNRLLSNTGHALISQCKVPILGRISMDQCTVDITDLPSPPQIGDIATFIGQQGTQTISANDFSALSQTIPYEIFCSLSKRVTRIYLNHPLF